MTLGTVQTEIESEMHYTMSHTKIGTPAVPAGMVLMAMAVWYSVYIYSCSGNSGPYQVARISSSPVDSVLLTRPSDTGSPSSGESPKTLALQSDSGVGPDAAAIKIIGRNCSSTPVTLISSPNFSGLLDQVWGWEL